MSKKSSQAGKGSKYRPTNKKKFDVNYDRIDWKKKNDKET